MECSPVDIDEEAIARTKGVNPAARRLQLGMSAIVGRSDGAVVELFPDGREVVLDPPSDSPSDHYAEAADENSRQRP